MTDTIHTQPELSDDELLRVYGLAKRDHNYEGSIDDWPKRAERAATVAGLRAAIAADRARAALSQPEPERPTRRQLMMLADDMGMASVGDAAEYARAALARWGRPAPQPADGEVAELAAWLRIAAGDPGSYSYVRVNRAADLLERLSPPQPIPVSERLPGQGDCDAEGMCWWWDRFEECWWYLRPINSEQALRSWSWTHWLPAHAMPTLRENV